MATYDEKEVTWRSLKKGTEVCGVKYSNGASYFHGIVDSVNAARVTILMWGKEPKEFNSEDTMFRVKMSREEFEQKYEVQAREILKALKTTVPAYAIGNAERDNSWFSYDPYEMAAKCKANTFLGAIRVVGVCQQPPWTHRSGGVEMDIAIVAERPNGERFWCHASSEYMRLVTFGTYDLSEQGVTA